MNTTAKGNAFEDRVFNAIKRELESGRLGLAPDSCKIFQKKGYYSKDRGGDIIVDISIEVTRPGAKDFSILWVCECKDYAGSVPVNDVEEFNDKLRQIAGKNVKGVIAIGRSGLQRSALSVAQANKIGVVRMLPREQVKWIMEHLSRGILEQRFDDSFNERLSEREFLNAITSPGFESVNRDFYALANGYLIGNLQTLLEETLGTA